MIQLIILLGIISIIDFSTKKIPVVVLVVMGMVGIASSFLCKAVNYISGCCPDSRYSAYGSCISYRRADRLWRCCCCDAYGIVCDS